MPLERLDLPAILRAVAELANAAVAYRPENHPEIISAQANPGAVDAPSVEEQFAWHADLDAILDAANRLKRALGATGELRPGRVLADKEPAAWRHFGLCFVDTDYARPVRAGLYRLAIAAVDLSGYAVLKQPLEPWRVGAMRFLGEGIRQIWGALSEIERDEVNELRSVFRRHFQWTGEPDAPPPVWAGSVEIVPEDEYRSINLDDFTRQSGERLQELAAISANFPRSARPASEQTSDPPESAPKHKQSTARGDGHLKLISALTNHHRYADGSCLNAAPIGNNELARMAEVQPSTASDFFKKKFKGHTAYKALCRDTAKLIVALKLLNNEFIPCDLYGRSPADEDDRDGE